MVRNWIEKQESKILFIVKKFAYFHISQNFEKIKILNFFLNSKKIKSDLTSFEKSYKNTSLVLLKKLVKNTQNA